MGNIPSSPQLAIIEESNCINWVVLFLRKELLHMVTGVLNTDPKAGIYITDDKKSRNINVRSGQYLYLSIRDCWIPVIVRYSPRSQEWVFQNLENINVNGQKVMIKQ